MTPVIYLEQEVSIDRSCESQLKPNLETFIDPSTSVHCVKATICSSKADVAALKELEDLSEEGPHRQWQLNTSLGCLAFKMAPQSRCM